MALLCSALIAGWCALTVAVHGHLLSDAAIAKQSGFNLGFLSALARTLFTVSPLWLLALPVAGLVARPGRFWKSAARGGLALAPLGAITMAGIVAGQSIEGVRYFLPPLAFAWWSALALHEESVAAGTPTARPVPALLIVGLLSSLPHTMLIHTPLSRVVEARRVILPPSLHKESGNLVLGAVEIGTVAWEADAHRGPWWSRARPSRGKGA